MSKYRLHYVTTAQDIPAVGGGGGRGVNIHCLGSLINNIDSCHRLLITNCFIIYMYGIATYATT